MVSIRKLAQLAQVSHVTVWNVLHEKPGVHPQLRTRILALADEYHYYPNRLAEGLLSGHTRTIGLIIEHVTWHFYSRLCNGVMHAASRDQAHVITLNSTGEGDANTRDLSSLISQLIEQRVDGIILATGNVPVPVKSVLEMWSHDIVPVLFETPSEKPLDRLETDERGLAHTALDYLLSLGHQRIVYCGFNRQRARDREMRRAFQTRGISLDYCLDESAVISGANPRQAEMHLDDFLRIPQTPTAVICHNDKMACQLLLHALQRGLRIPGDLSILGCGNDIMCRYLTPALNSIEQFPEEIGARAYVLIQRRRKEKTEPGERVPETILVPPQLMLRDSCGPPEPRRPAPSLPSPEALPSPATPELDEHTTEVTMEVNTLLARVLPCCIGARSKHELMTRLGLHNAEHFRKAYLQPALQAGYLERTIPEKPHSSRQRYRLTTKGQAVIQR